MVLLFVIAFLLHPDNGIRIRCRHEETHLLEARLGVTLFHRTTRKLSITDAGRRYLDASERVLTDMEAADAAVSDDTVTPRGLVRLNAPVVFGTHGACGNDPPWGALATLATVGAARLVLAGFDRHATKRERTTQASARFVIGVLPSGIRTRRVQRRQAR